MEHTSSEKKTQWSTLQPKRRLNGAQFVRKEDSKEHTSSEKKTQWSTLRPKRRLNGAHFVRKEDSMENTSSEKKTQWSTFRPKRRLNGAHFGRKEDSMENTSSEKKTQWSTLRPKRRLNGVHFGRRIWNCFPTILCHLEEEFYSSEFFVFEMICHIAVWLLTRGKPYWLTFKLRIYVSRFWQLNYFTKFANALGLYAVAWQLIWLAQLEIEFGRN